MRWWVLVMCTGCELGETSCAAAQARQACLIYTSSAAYSGPPDDGPLPAAAEWTEDADLHGRAADRAARAAVIDVRWSGLADAYSTTADADRWVASNMKVRPRYMQEWSEEEREEVADYLEVVDGVDATIRAECRKAKQAE